MVKLVLHSPNGTARLTYDAEGKLVEGHALEIGKEATQMEVVCGEHYFIHNDKNTCIAGDEVALREALADFPIDDITEMFRLMMEKVVETEDDTDDANDADADADDLDDINDIDDLLDEV